MLSLESVLKWLLGLLFGWALWGAAGCQNPNDPVNQQMANFKQAVTAIFEKAGEDTIVTSGQLTGNASIERPGYRIKGYAGLFNGVMFDGEVYIEGIDGQFAGGLSLGARPDANVDTAASENPVVPLTD